jgi:hypothetical protein
MFTPLLDKLAEPPPPEGVSVKAWDKILQKGPRPMPKTATVDVDLIRKTAERLAFEELTAPPELSPEQNILFLKMSSVADEELFKVAMGLSQGLPSVYDMDQALQTYEELGGTYKHAFGAPMFDVKQMAGSPAVSGGMASRAKTPSPQMPQQPVSVTTTTLGNQQGGVSAPSAPSATSGTSTPSSPTG